MKKDILDYIVSTEHYIFNWIDDKNVQDFIKEYPDEYEDMIYLHVIHASSSPTIRIYFENHPDDVKYIERYTVLSTFKDSTKAIWIKWNGRVNELQIAEKEEELAHLKEKQKTLEKYIEYLKNNK